jgi:hypothetical protein
MPAARSAIGTADEMATNYPSDCAFWNFFACLPSWRFWSSGFSVRGSILNRLPWRLL